jgi:hypothetical protein
MAATVATVATKSGNGGAVGARLRQSIQAPPAVSFLDGRNWQRKSPVADEAAVIDWLNTNPAPSLPSSCGHCGATERPSDPLVPHGVESTGHVWLHRSCWTVWMASRRAQALVALGVTAPEPVQTPTPMADIIFDCMVSLFQEAPIPLAKKCDDEAMANCYRAYVERDDVTPHQDFIDWGLVPQDFEQKWANALALWFTEVQDAAKRIHSNCKPK